MQRKRKFYRFNRISSIAYLRHCSIALKYGSQYLCMALLKGIHEDDVLDIFERSLSLLQ